MIIGRIGHEKLTVLHSRNVLAQSQQRDGPPDKS